MSGTELQVVTGGAMAAADSVSAHVMEQVIATGNLAALTAPQRVEYYNALCKSLRLNPLTKPFEYITLNGKLTLYARKDATDQIRRTLDVSITHLDKQFEEGLYIVTAHAQIPGGRVDTSTGAVSIDSLKGEARANAIMKAETKAKRRVTLSICGLGFLDESEVDSIADAGRPVVNHETGDILEAEETPKQRWGRLRNETIEKIKALPADRQTYWLSEIDKRYGDRKMAQVTIAQFTDLLIEIDHTEAAQSRANVMTDDVIEGELAHRRLTAELSRHSAPHSTFRQSADARAVPAADPAPAASDTGKRDTSEKQQLRVKIDQLKRELWTLPETRDGHYQEFLQAHFNLTDTTRADKDTLHQIANALQGRVNARQAAMDADDEGDPFADTPATGDLHLNIGGEA